MHVSLVIARAPCLFSVFASYGTTSIHIDVSHSTTIESARYFIDVQLSHKLVRRLTFIFSRIARTGKHARHIRYKKISYFYVT